MPNKYTENIVAGQTFEDFALGCAGRFLPEVEEVDAITPVVDVVPADVTAEQADLATAQAAFNAHNTMTVGAATATVDAEYQTRLQARDNAVGVNDAKRAKYQAMLDQVNAWSAPDDTSIALKELMIALLEEALSLDCGRDPRLPVRDNPAAWLATKIAVTATQVERCHRIIAEKEAEAATRNAFVAALKGSL